MAETNNFTVTVISETGVIFFDECKALFVPSEQGTMAILRSFTPTIMKLVPGDVAVRQGKHNTIVCRIKTGLLKVEDNNAVVLVVQDKEGMTPEVG
jgi:F0F1-type ATP synthase epsilon subunit